MAAVVGLGGFRTLVNVPMLKEDELIGTIAIYLQEVRAFTDKQIELVTNFAAQAVIAIENTRLLHELQARTGELAQSVGERALGEMSQAVNSTVDLETVLTTIVARQPSFPVLKRLVPCVRRCRTGIQAKGDPRIGQQRRRGNQRSPYPDWRDGDR